MFKGRVERVSHEGGLLVSYSGACPALDSVMVDSNENYVGKVDGVIGNLNNSLVHVAHLDRKSNANSMIGIEITVRARRPKQDRPQRRDSREKRQNRDHNRGKERRGNERHGNNDWDCPKCNNSNFSFRTECNRCGEPKGRGKRNRNDRRNQRDERRGNRERNKRQSDRRPQRGSREWSGNDRRMGDRGDSSPPARAGDWDCPQCGKSNFAKRTECFSCGRSKRIGGPRRKGHHFSRDPAPLRSHRYGKGAGRRDE